MICCSLWCSLSPVTYSNHFCLFFFYARQGLRRPNTAQSRPTDTGIKKEYALNVDTEPSEEPTMPQLVQHDLEDIYEPVKLPKIRSVIIYSN